MEGLERGTRVRMHANRCQCLAHADYLVALVPLARRRHSPSTRVLPISRHGKQRETDLCARQRRSVRGPAGEVVLHVRGQHRDGEAPGSNESLKEALHTVTERSDIKFGDVVYATDYRQVPQRSQLRSTLTKMVLGRAFGWPIHSARAASSLLGMLLISTPHAEVK